ncbi:MAG: hypothetical protein EP343_16435 [Deltaproteobacteria bacterium]|nr:MAG: hypothetical protein EP343_16435 [Deltaproteobacteria bacterium]
MGPQPTPRHNQNPKNHPHISIRENKQTPSSNPHSTSSQTGTERTLASLFGTDRWAPHWNLPRREAWVEGLRSLGRRPSCSGKERRAFSALYEQLQNRYSSTKWHSMAVSAPLWPPTFFYSCAALVLFGLSWFAPMGTSLLAAVLAFCLWKEWTGSFRYSQLVFAPRGTSYLSVVQEARPECPKLVLCAGVDTPTGDPTYHTEPYQSQLRWLHRQGLTPGMFLWVGVASIPISNTLRLTLVLPWLSSWLLVQGLFLVGLCSYFYITAERRGNTTHNNLAVGAAIETYEQLRHIDLPFQVELLLLGSTSQGIGIESWIRQNRHRYTPDQTFFLIVEPSARTATHLYYRTHEGPIQRAPAHQEIQSAAEEIALRFATEMKMDNVPGPQRRFGASLASVAQQQGYAALALGANFESRSDSLVGQHLVGWGVAVAQSLGIKQNSKHNPTPPQ